MNVNVQSIGFVADGKLEAFIHNRVEKLLKFDVGIIGIEVFLRLVKSSTTDNKVVEISLDLKGADLFAKKQSKTFEESTDLVVEALRRQLVKHRDKLRAK